MSKSDETPRCPLCQRELKLQVKASMHGEKVWMCERCVMLLTDRDLQSVGESRMSLPVRLIAVAGTIGAFLVLLIFLLLLCAFCAPI